MERCSFSSSSLETLSKDASQIARAAVLTVSSEGRVPEPRGRLPLSLTPIVLPGIRLKSPIVNTAFILKDERELTEG